MTRKSASTKMIVSILTAIKENLDHNCQVGHSTAALIGAKGFPGGFGQRFQQAALVTTSAGIAKLLRKKHRGLRVISLDDFKGLREHAGPFVFDPQAVWMIAIMALDQIEKSENV